MSSEALGHGMMPDEKSIHRPGCEKTSLMLLRLPRTPRKRTTLTKSPLQAYFPPHPNHPTQMPLVLPHCHLLLPATSGQLEEGSVVHRVAAQASKETQDPDPARRLKRKDTRSKMWKSQTAWLTVAAGEMSVNSHQNRGHPQMHLPATTHLLYRKYSSVLQRPD